jgi:hypothetical protein
MAFYDETIDTLATIAAHLKIAPRPDPCVLECGPRSWKRGACCICPIGSGRPIRPLIAFSPEHLDEVRQLISVLSTPQFGANLNEVQTVTEEDGEA